MTAVSLTVNGRPISAEVEPRQHLGDFLRETLLLTATHLGCEHGVCGACTVLIDGAPARSCIAFTAALDGAAVTTLEGLADDPVTGRLREAFKAHHALQCGFCTPGLLVMARDIVLRKPGAEERTIRHELAGNLCRCTGYVGIVRAIKAVADAQATAPLATGAPAAPASPLSLPVSPPRLAGPGAAAPAVATPPPSAPAEAPEPLRNPVTIEETFTLPAARATVWRLFQDPASVVACLPGARLTAPSEGRAIAAELVVKLGPIQAGLAGTGTMTTDPATWSGALDGGAVDRRSASRIRARLNYRLEEDGPDATIVHLDIAYVLQGPLAQVSRGALARDLAARLTQVFAARVAARLDGTTPEAAPAPLEAGSLLLAMLMGWWGRVFRRG